MKKYGVIVEDARAAELTALLQKTSLYKAGKRKR
jgi:hypothetical protein